MSRERQVASVVTGRDDDVLELFSSTKRPRALTEN